LKKPLLLAGIILISLAISYAVPQSGPSASANSDKIGPSAVWQPPQDFVAKAHAACDKSNPPDYSKCFIDQMSASGSPARAVSFALMLYRQSDGQVGIMIAFEKVGPVDVARVMYPLRANDNYGLVLVNGDPAVLDVDDLKKLNRAEMEQSPLYQAVKQKYTGTDIWPGDRSGTMWPQEKPLPGGGQQFIIGYPLLNGCHACATTGLARFSWNFDGKGKFLGTKYIPSPPPPKLMRPNRVPQPPPATDQPQPPAQTQPQS
jgi:hypothetical protein